MGAYKQLQIEFDEEFAEKNQSDLTKAENKEHFVQEDYEENWAEGYDEYFGNGNNVYFGNDNNVYFRNGNNVYFRDDEVYFKEQKDTAKHIENSLTDYYQNIPVTPSTLEYGYKSGSYSPETKGIHREEVMGISPTTGPVTEPHKGCKHKIKMTITKKVIVTYCEKCGKILDQVKR